MTAIARVLSRGMMHGIIEPRGDWAPRHLGCPPAVARLVREHLAGVCTPGLRATLSLGLRATLRLGLRHRGGAWQNEADPKRTRHVETGRRGRPQRRV